MRCLDVISVAPQKFDSDFVLCSSSRKANQGYCPMTAFWPREMRVLKMLGFTPHPGGLTLAAMNYMG